MNMDTQQIITSVASALAVLILTGIFSIISGYIKKNEEREKIKEQRLSSYFKKTDAILYAFAVASDKIVADTFQKAYRQKLHEYDLQDDTLKKTG